MKLANQINIFYTLFIINTIYVYSITNQKFIGSTHKENARSPVGFSYRTLLFEKIDQENTPLKPDSESSELRLSKEELGRFTWAFLHSTAAAYPQNPTETEKINLVNLLNSIPVLYPCKDCAGHFKEMLNKYPIKNSSRSELIEYICFLHNKVNERLNKPIFDCTKAANYWGGDCGCSANKSK